MYDILQLNDMIVPELLDIAEQLKISNAKKLDKQDLIYKILDGQAVDAKPGKNGEEEKRKRKRVIKATTANVTEEAFVDNKTDGKVDAKEEEKPRKPEMKKISAKKEDKQQLRKPSRRKTEEEPQDQGNSIDPVNQVEARKTRETGTPSDGNVARREDNDREDNDREDNDEGMEEEGNEEGGDSVNEETDNYQGTQAASDSAIAKVTLNVATTFLILSLME